MTDIERLRWSFWRGDEGVAVEPVGEEGRLRAFAVRRDGTHELPQFIESESLEALRSGAVSRIDPNINFSWKKTPPPTAAGDEDFSVSWQGEIRFPEPHRWRLYLITVGSVAVSIDGRQVASRDAVDTPAEVEAIVHFDIEPNPRDRSPRTAQIRVDYTDSAYGSIRLEWFREERKGWKDWGPIPRAAVPDTALYTQLPSGEATQGLAATYYPDPDADLIGELEPLHLVDDDQGVWAGQHGNGTLDLRYEAGAVRLARGDVELLSLPMDQPPERVLMETHCTLQNAEYLRLPPLDIENRRQSLACRSETLSPADLEWPVVPAAAANVAFRSAKGRFFRRAGSDDAWDALTTVEHRTGCEITMRVDTATVGAGVAIADPTRDGESLRLFVVEHEGKRILCFRPFDPDDVAAHREQGWLIGDAFWVRLTAGLEDVRLAFSNNGETWIPAGECLFAESRPVNTLIQFGACGAAGGGDQAIEISDIRVTRWQGLEKLAADDLAAHAAQLLENPAGASPDWSVRYQSLIDARPEGASPAQWEIACRLAMLAAATPSPLRQEHAIEIVRLGLRGEADWQRVEPALLELPRRMNLSEHPFTWHDLGSLYDAAARDYWPDTARRRRIPDLTDTWHRQERSAKRVFWGQAACCPSRRSFAG
jgi:hypothetical protein